jgi:hypothetical protein
MYFKPKKKYISYRFFTGVKLLPKVENTCRSWDAKSIFECKMKLLGKIQVILKQFCYLEQTNSFDFTGKQQHGFKNVKVLQLLV